MNEKESSINYIIEAFFLLLKTNNIENISISDICQKAGVSRVTFYRNFKDKIDIINTYFSLMIKQFIIEMGTNTHYDYYHIAYHTFEMLKKEKENILSLINNNLSYMYQNLLNHHFDKNFKNDNYGSKLTAYIFAGALYNISLYWIKNDCKESIDEIITEFFKICNFDDKKPLN